MIARPEWITPEADTPPYAEASEQTILAAMLDDADACERAVEELQASDFYAERHRRIFAAIALLASRRVLCDAVAVTQELHASGAGDLAPLVFQLTGNGFGANVGYHVGVVRDRATARRVAEAAGKVRHMALSAAVGQAEGVHAEAERLMREAAAPPRGPSVTQVREFLTEVMVEIEAIGDGAAPVGVRTGIEESDRLTGGFKRGDFVLYAARPSMGKSAIGVCNAAAHAAIRQQLGTHVFSQETKAKRLIRRLIASEARVNMRAAEKRGHFREDEFVRMGEALPLLNAAPLYVDDTPGLTVDMMRAKLRQARREGKAVDVVVEDYIGKMRHPKARSRYEEVSEIARGLKDIAQEFDCVVIGLSQLSRAVEARPDKRPMMSDLRESGELEQEADLIGLLYRPEYYFGPTMKVGKGKDTREINVEGRAEIIWAKVRDGDTGTAHVNYVKEFTHFEDPRGREAA